MAFIIKENYKKTTLMWHTFRLDFGATCNCWVEKTWIIFADEQYCLKYRNYQSMLKLINSTGER